MRRMFAAEFGDPALAARHGLDRTYVLQVQQGTDTQAMVGAFSAIGDEVEFAGRDVVGGVADEAITQGSRSEAVSSVSELIPDDEWFGLQWGMHNTGQMISGQAGTPDADIDAPEAWAIHTGNFGSVVVAIIDSGVSSHPEYGDNAAPYPNGRVLQGYNTVLNSSDPADLDDTCPNGTRVAGIVGASGNNMEGVAGVSWGAYLLPVKVLTNCTGTASNCNSGIVWAADHGADIINIALQYNLSDPGTIAAMQAAVNYAHDQGALVIAATGANNFCGVGAVCYPGRLANVLAVGATDKDDQLASFSSYGPETDLTAPGAQIFSTSPANYSFGSGTTQSSAHASGLAALIKSYAPYRTNDQIAQILHDTVDDLGPAGWDNHFGYGRINAARALAAALQCDDVLECDDGNLCTDDDCVGGLCAFINNTAPCGDSVPCTVGDTCADGSCGVPDDAMCEDGNVCTLDVCDPLIGCIHQSVVCDDSNLCTTDTCDPMSGCVYTPSVVCDVPPGDPACHEPGVCVPTTGMCDYVPFLEGDRCTPQPVDPCCAEYACVASVCTARCDPLCDDGNACTTDRCDPMSGCVYTPSVVCDVPPGDPACHEPGVCVPTTGMCDYVPFLEGDQCTPQPVDPCCAEYACVASVCTAQCDPLCDDGNACTTDTCGPNGCVNLPVDCEDGLFCTADSCEPDTGCIATSACPPATDGCVFRNISCDENNDVCVDAADDEFCDDGDSCNGLESCSLATGACLPGSAPNCLDGDGCCPDGCTDDTDSDCPLTPIPTVSTWGLIVLALLLATMAKLYFGRRAEGGFAPQ